MPSLLTGFLSIPFNKLPWFKIDCDGTSQSTDGCRCDDIRLAQRPDCK